MRLSYSPLLFLVFLVGCASEYEMTFKYPNPLHLQRVIAVEKPRVDTERILTYKDESGQVIQIEGKYIDRVVGPPKIEGAAGSGLPYDIHLTEDNPYGITFLRSLAKPTYESRESYVFKTSKDAEEQRISKNFVTGIAPFEGKKGSSGSNEELFSSGSGKPNYRSTFEFR